jgi:hypothetical protein
MGVIFEEKNIHLRIEWRFVKNKMKISAAGLKRALNPVGMFICAKTGP